MSIWSTIIDIGPVQDVDYQPSEAVAGGVDVASAEPWYGGDGLRLSVTEPTVRRWNEGEFAAEAQCVLSREQVVELRDGLTAWLQATEASHGIRHPD